MSKITHFAGRENAMKNPLNRIATLAVRVAFAAHSTVNLKLAVRLSGLALVFVFGVQQMSATVTYYVGTCKLGDTFTTIQSALDASPAPNVVAVCPGQYAEQLNITKPVTIEGITGNTGDRAQIILPDNYGVNTTLTDDGDSMPAVAQVLVHNVSGAVNLTNLAVNGEGFGLNDVHFVGIVYENSSGTINRVITAFQNGDGASNVVGFGMWIQGGSAKPTVAVENSSIHDFEADGVLVTGTTTATELTVAIKNNFISSTFSASYGIAVEPGSNATVTGNVANVGLVGISIDSSPASVSGNTLVGSTAGILLSVDGPSVKSNNIFNTTNFGIDVSVALKTSVVEDNTIRTVNEPGSLDVTGMGINLDCQKTSSTQVNSNTIADSLYGYGNAPAGFGGVNNYVGVVTEVGTCTNASVANKEIVPARMKWLEQSREQ
jgi:hypothetical protein